MGYRETAQEFLDRSREELRRLENEMALVNTVVHTLEKALEAEKAPEPASIPPRPSPSRLFPQFSPSMPPEESPPSGDRKPVGEIAEALLRERRAPMSLEELYQLMKGRRDILASSDLKNAIRVALIRRRPRIVSEKRGWFRYVDFS